MSLDDVDGRGKFVNNSRIPKDYIKLDESYNRRKYRNRVVELK